MARRPREFAKSEADDLNLAPFMNMVIILIPMLLLSVVFLEVAVINVTMPLGGATTTTEEKDPEVQPLNLAIAMSPRGFYVSAVGAIVPPIDGCPTQGPTICLADDTVDVQARFEDARRLMAAGNPGAGEEELEVGLQAFNYRELYNLLSRFKEQYPSETTVRLTADADVPFALTVRVMDVSRYRLEEISYDSNEDFWRADFDTEINEDGDEQYAVLFGDPAFAVAQ